MSNSLATLESEAAQWYRNNMLKPIAGKTAFVDEVSALYSPPFTYLELDGEIPLTDDNAAREFIQGFSDWLDESPGWSAEVVDIQTQALNDSAMLLVAEWRLLDAEGKPITEGDTAQFFYTLSKRAGVWGIVGEATVSAKTRVNLA